MKLSFFFLIYLIQIALIFFLAFTYNWPEYIALFLGVCAYGLSYITSEYIFSDLVR